MAIKTSEFCIAEESLTHDKEENASMFIQHAYIPTYQCHIEPSMASDIYWRL